MLWFIGRYLKLQNLVCNVLVFYMVEQFCYYLLDINFDLLDCNFVLLEFYVDWLVIYMFNLKLKKGKFLVFVIKLFYEVYLISRFFN